MDNSDLTVRKLMKRSVMPHLKKIADLIAKIDSGKTKISDKNEKRVHDLRTETRRLDVALDLFDGWLPDDRTNWLRKQLKKLRKKAGTVRNFDVMIPLLKDTAKPLPRKVKKWLMKRVRSERTDGTASLRQVCRKVSHRQFKRQGLSLKRHFGWTKSSAAPSIKEFGLRQIHKHGRSFISRAERVKDDPTALHPARIAGRKLRYALELLEETLVESLVAALCDRLSELQDMLGKANDEDSALNFLNDVESNCHDKVIATSLPKAITALDATAEKDLKSAIHDLTRISERVQTLLDELTSQTKSAVRSN